MSETQKETPVDEEQRVEWETYLTAVRKVRLTKPKTLVICGFAPTSRHLAPYDKRTVEIWGCNESYSEEFMVTKEGKFRADRWFQMHLEEDWGRANNPNDPRHPEWIRSKHNFPIVMQDADMGPSAVSFPLEETDKLFFGNAWILDKDGKSHPWLEVNEHGFYSSTFAWMMAYAIWQRETGVVEWENIDIYGFHVASQSEYMYQKPCAEWWVSQAMGRGMNVRIAAESSLMRGALYGYDIAVSILPSQIEKRIVEVESELPNLKEAALQRHGAKLMMNELTKNEKFIEQLPILDRIAQQQQQDELTAVAKVNFYLAALGDSKKLLSKLEGRHESETGGTGGIDRMTLEVHKHKIREAIAEARGVMDSVSGALSECRRLKSTEIDPERLGSLVLRESKLLNTLIYWSGALNSLLGSISNIEWFMVQTESRDPNFTDEYDYGMLVLPDLFDLELDVTKLSTGENTDGKTREEKSETENEGGASSGTVESG